MCAHEQGAGFAARLKEAHERSGLSFRALAQAADLTSWGLQLLEKGEREPKIGTVERLATALGVSAGWLAFGA